MADSNPNNKFTSSGEKLGWHEDEIKKTNERLDEIQKEHGLEGRLLKLEDGITAFGVQLDGVTAKARKIETDFNELRSSGRKRLLLWGFSFVFFLLTIAVLVGIAWKMSRQPFQPTGQLIIAETGDFDLNYDKPTRSVATRPTTQEGYCYFRHYLLKKEYSKAPTVLLVFNRFDIHFAGEIPRLQPVATNIRRVDTESNKWEFDLEVGLWDINDKFLLCRGTYLVIADP